VTRAEADERHLRRAIELARRARDHGNQPFGSLVVDPHGETVVEAESTVVTGRDWTGHAELNAVRAAADVLGLRALGGYTLYASTEPCAMCTAAAYWAGVGRIVYALGAERFQEVARVHDGPGKLALPCRDVVARGGRTMEVAGPHLEEEAAAVHDGFW
jgi:tRNA(Arg) A34 adenosine deaminase TadA